MLCNYNAVRPEWLLFLSLLFFVTIPVACKDIAASSEPAGKVTDDYSEEFVFNVPPLPGKLRDRWPIRD